MWGRVPNKDCYFMFTFTFWHFFVVFHQKICIFIIFISFFWWNITFLQQNINLWEPELVIKDCLWNSIEDVEWKQSHLCVLQKSFSERFCDTHRKKPVVKSLFNKVTGLQPTTWLRNRLWHSCFPVCFNPNKVGLFEGSFF